MVQRILAFFILILSVLFMPLWVSAPLAIIFMICFNVFFEGALAFLLADLLYETRQVRFFNFFLVSFVVSGIVLLLIETTKKKLKFYKNK